MATLMTDEAYAFFLEHAGYSYDPAKETREEGRKRCARALACAELEAKRLGLEYDWTMDDITNRDFTDAGNEYYLWRCAAMFNGKCVASLCGIDFGEGKEPWGQDYARVVEAELAFECVDELAEQVS